MFWLRYVILCLSCGILRCLNLCLFLQLSLVNCAIVSAVSACLPISVCGYFPSFIFLAGKVLNSLILTLYSQLPHDHRRVRHSKILWTFLFPTFSNKDNLDTFFYTKSAPKKNCLGLFGFLFSCVNLERHFPGANSFPVCLKIASLLVCFVSLSLSPVLKLHANSSVLLKYKFLKVRTMFY